MLSSAELLPHTKTLLAFLKDNKQKGGTLLLSGAGVSTDSGIPDYRGHNGSYYKAHRPTTHQEFIEPNSVLLRKRYWARSIFGYSGFHNAMPNDGHRAMAKLEEFGLLGVPTRDVTCVTQNVDGLHQRGGMRSVLELHGSGHHVECLSCGHEVKRIDYQRTLAKLNADFVDGINAQSTDTNDRSKELMPDGDANLENQDFSSLIVPSCESCSEGLMKPSVTFFGAAVEKELVERVYRACDDAAGLVVAGSSLTVYSAFRFVKFMHDAGKPICIINSGETRGDPLASLKLSVDVTDVFKQAVEVTKAEKEGKEKINTVNQ